MTRTLTKMAVATVGLTIAQALSAVLVPASARQVAIGLPLAVTATSLIVGVLLLVAAHARDTGFGLAMVLFGLWGSVQANYLIEAVVFDIGVPRADQPWLFAHALASALAAGLIVAFVNRVPHPHAATAVRPNAPGVPWLTLLACGVIYLVLYIGAGVVIAWPTSSRTIRAVRCPVPPWCSRCRPSAVPRSG